VDEEREPPLRAEDGGADDLTGPVGPVPSDAAITAAFVELDQRCQDAKYEHPRSGTTAIALMMAQQDGQAIIKCAWVGDSRAVMVDATGTVTDLTTDHSIHDNEPERVRVEEQHDHEPREGLLDSAGWEMERRNAERNGGRLRAGSYIARREINGRVAGPRVIFAHTGGVSLQVSRSIGDSLAARSVIPHPEITSFKAPVDGYARFILASDGLWDVVSSKEVGRLVRSTRDPQRASTKLATAAKTRRLNQGRSMDDITVIVVDANADAFKTGVAGGVGAAGGKDKNCVVS